MKVRGLDVGAEPIFQVIEGLVLVIAKRIEDADRLYELLIPFGKLVPDEKSPLITANRKANFINYVQIQIGNVGDDKRRAENAGGALRL